MGTHLGLTVVAADRSTALSASQAALEAIDATDARLSTWRAGTELHALNTSVPGRWVALSPELERDLEEATRWWIDTDGAFDPAVASLVETWDLRGGGRAPTAAELERARASSGLGSLELDGSRARWVAPGFGIDEGGFGKGVALRDAAAAALNSGATCIELDFGGQILLRGECLERTVGIADPRDRDRAVAEIRLRSGSVATSGNSQRRVDVDGRVLGHILDPATGQPTASWGSVTVITDDPVAADCAATALFVMGPERGMEWVATRPDIRAIFVAIDGETTRLTAVPRDLVSSVGPKPTMVVGRIDETTTTNDGR